MKAILNVDTGTDDAVAIMLAALHPGVDLIGVVTVTGNRLVEVTTENTLRVLDEIGADVPVYAGQRAPLVRDDLPIPRDTPPPSWPAYPGNGLLELPEARSRAADRGAVEFLVETYRAATEPVALVATAPLTNLAVALHLEPRLRDLIPKLLIMGGAYGPGNITPRAEFNVWADPEAAHVVLGAGLADVTLVGLDATRRAAISRGDADRLRGLDTPAGRAAADLAELRIASTPGSDATAPLHDALCVAALIDPAVVRAHAANVRVEITSPLTVGETVVDLDGRLTGTEPNARIALDADTARFVSILCDAFQPRT